MEDCIFCKISKKEISTEVLFENNEVIAFYDVKPIVPVHVLVIPKRHISSVTEISEKDSNLMGQLIFSATEIAKKLGVSKDGYKLLFRAGKNGGQEVPHIHLHLLGGAELYEEIRIK